MNSKEKVLKFLKENSNKQFSIRRIHKKIRLAYPTVQRAVEVLKAENKIEVKNLGSLKLVSFKELKNEIKK